MKCDQYRWRNYGRKKLQTSPVIGKTYYHHDGTDDPEFKRCAYVFQNSSNYRVAIHYKGDDSVAADSKSYLRTCPSVLRELEKSEVPPSVAYKRKVSSSVIIEHQSVLLPRNSKQIKNLQSRQRQKMKISHDSLYNLHEIAYDLNDFVHQIITYPDLVVVCVLRVMLAETNRVLKLGSSSHLMSYDTTFKLGDFYVSPLVFRNAIFKKSPVMPAIFMLHERKLKSTHNELMSSTARELPCLVSGKNMVPKVTNEEKGFEAIEQHLPKIRRFFCWNHIINSAKRWLNSHGESASEVPVYISNLRDLFHQETEKDYLLSLHEIELKWSQAFLHYYMSELHSKVNIKC